MHTFSQLHDSIVREHGLQRHAQQQGGDIQGRKREACVDVRALRVHCSKQQLK